MSVVEVVGGEDDLLEIIDALRPGGGIADFLHRRQQEPDQDRDDRNHDQELDERESPADRLGR